MSDRILRLDADELWCVLELIDPVELVAAELSGQAADREDHKSCRLVAASDLAAVAVAADSLLLEDSRTGIRCFLPASTLFGIRTAALVALAARLLLNPGVVTLGVLGSGSAVQLQLAVVARHVSGISFAAVWPAGAQDTVPVEMRVLDLLDGAGIGLLIAPDAEEAMVGANLLVGAGTGPAFSPPKRLTSGAVFVNATGRDLPDDVINGVNEIYVDDARLLERNRHRRFVRRHLDGTTRGPEPLRRPEGWHRQQTQGRPRRVDADLGQVLTGAHPGRTHIDDVLLVELLGLRELDVTLACRLQRAALENGVGDWLFEQHREGKTNQ